jgi:myo-inositol-1(or 4)-monophosphatase
MDLDTLWKHIFSEDETLIRQVWGGLTEDEKQSVRELLERITRDRERIEAQRIAAQYALTAIGPGQVSNSQASHPDLPDRALDFARELARETGLYLKATFGQLTASLKRDGTLVTESDLESDRRLSRAILKRFPGHSILSEEHEKVYRGQEWCWVIDPIDGTTNFTWGFPIWGVLIGLLHFGQPVLGVADFPMTNEQYSAVRGGGAYLNGALIHTASIRQHPTTGIPELHPTQLFACCTRTLKYGRVNLPAKLRVAGAAGYDLALVARGTCIGCVEMTVHVWDVAALWPVILESGGRISTTVPDGLFPLVMDRDYAEVEFSMLAGCSQPVLDLLRSRLSDRLILPSGLA